MSVLAASDLDRTLIYSTKASKLGGERPPVVCVEIHDGKQTSFMTAVAAQGLVALAAAATLVPVTTRVPAQFERITLPGPAPRYAVVANGGLLYLDGTLDRTWSARVERELARGFPLADVWEQAGHVCHPEWTIKLRNAAELFCYAVVHPHRLPEGFVSDIAGWAAERGWRVSLQGRKLYWVPEALSKSAAVAEIARRIDADLVLAAGDSLLDTDLLLSADLGIHPRHGELYDSGWSSPNTVQTASAGVCAGEQIVDWFASNVARVSGAAFPAGDRAGSAFPAGARFGTSTATVGGEEPRGPVARGEEPRGTGRPGGKCRPEPVPPHA